MTVLPMKHYLQVKWLEGEKFMHALDSSLCYIFRRLTDIRSVFEKKYTLLEGEGNEDEEGRNFWVMKKKKKKREDKRGLNWRIHLMW